ncbi:MAG TPA: integrase arm-type DNA-binding domain-containing protein [Usitatibacter sp.]|jgi:integrase|nr:integrase arm-type DNA-binding domain-containing protein [Usitatibacter sp.]
MAGSDFLTDRAVKNARTKTKPYKLSDGRGMYLLIKSDEGKYWRLKYRHAGKEKLLALGVYPDVSLQRARSLRDAAREQVAAGIDPSAARQAEKLEKRIAAANTFEAVAREWYAKQAPRWSSSHARAVLVRLQNELFKYIGNKPIAAIDAATMLDVLRKIEARGALETLSKTRIAAGQIFRYAIGSRRAKSDPTRDLRGQFETREHRHYARLNEGDLGDFLVKLEAYDGTPITKMAIRLLALTFVRTGELRGGHWTEFDFEKGEWRIPAVRMKSSVEHIVPLSDQAIATLGELQALTGDNDYLFPNEHRDGKPMSENTILYALYRMGYRGRATGHGFRATASTILNEQGWDADVIERQLAHKEQNQIRAAYHHAQYLPERRKMMQAWADFLEAKQRSGEKVVSMKRKRA